MPSEKSPLAVRLAQTDAKSWREINQLLEGPSFNRLLNDLAVEILRVTQSNPFTMVDARLVVRLRQDTKVRAILQDLARREVTRRVSNSETISAKLPLLFADRQRISFFANQLRWTVAQVVLEALQAACVFGSADAPIHGLPPLMAQFRGSMVYQGAFEKETAAHILPKLNQGLGLLGKPNLSPVPPPEPPMECYVDLI